MLKGPVKHLNLFAFHHWTVQNHLYLTMIRRGLWHLRKISQPQDAVRTSGTCHMKSHPRNKTRQIRSKEQNHCTQVAETLYAERESENKDVWCCEAWQTFCQALVTLRCPLCALRCGWLRWGDVPENVFCDLHPLIRVRDAAPCGQPHRSERWDSADLSYDRRDRIHC